MRAYIIRRLLLIIPTLFLLSVLVFFSVRFIPGDVIDAMLGRMEQQIGNVDREILERKLGLDVPGHVQYGRWIGGIVLHGTLGQSMMSPRISDKGWIGQGSDQDLAELARYTRFSMWECGSDIIARANRLPTR